MLLGLATVALLTATSVGAAAQQRSRKPRPTPPSSLAIVEVTATSLTARWSASTDDVGVTGYEVRVNRRLVGVTTSTSYTAGGLACGRTYEIAVRAFDADGNYSRATKVSAATAPCPDTKPPTTPGELVTTYRSTTSISVSWGASTDNVGVVAYGTYVDGLHVGNAASTAYTFSGLVCDRNYTLAVDAVDGAGNRSSKRTAMVATAPCPDLTRPSDPDVTVADASETDISVTWKPSTDNVGVDRYEVSVDEHLLESVGPDTHGYGIGGLECGSPYTVSIVAFDAAGNRSNGTWVSTATATCPSSPPTDDTTPPSAPGALTASSVTRTSIALEWGPATDNVGVTEYGVYVGSQRVVSTASTSYVLSGLTCNTSYQMAVDAADAVGNRSAPSSAVVATAPCADTTPPSAPTGLTQTANDETSATIAWSPSTDDVGVVSYGVYRAGLLVASVTSTSATVTGLQCGTSTAVEVDAADAAGNRSARASIFVTTGACADTSPPTVPSGLTLSATTQSSLALQWQPSTDNVAVAGYRLQRNGTVTGTTTSTNATFSGLSCGTPYTLGVAAFDAAGNNSATATLSATTTACSSDTQAPTTPSNLTAASVGQTSVGLSWSASSDNVGVAGYGVYNGSASAGTTSSTSYTVSGLTCGTSYALGVDAYDAAGNRSAKASVTVATSGCSAPSSGSAHLWVDTNGGSCTRQASPGAYADAQACGTFDAAWDAAQSGDTIRVQPGNYPGQNVTGNKISVTKIIGEPGVVIGSGPKVGNCSYGPAQGWMQASGNFMWLENVTIDVGSGHGQGAGGCIDASDVTYRNVNLYGPFVSLYLVGPRFTWSGGRLGQDGTVGGQRSCTNSDGQPIWIEPSAAGTTIDGVRFNPQDADPTPRTCQPGNGFHLEDVRIQSAHNVTIVNSTFVDSSGVPGNGDGSGNIFVTSASASTTAASGLRLENNVFERVKGTYAIQIHANVQRYNDWIVKRNRFDQPVLDPGTYVNLVSCGNTGDVLDSWKAACA